MAPPGRSSAVTVLGVLFLSLGGMWLLGAVLQGAFLGLLSAMRPGGISMGDVAANPHTPSAIRHVLRYAGLWLPLSFAGALGLMLASIALIRRRPWARVAFILAGGAGIVYVAFSLAASAALASYFRSAQAGLEKLGDGSGLPAMAAFVLVLVSVKTALLGVFFGWMIWKLTRPGVKAEFGRPRPASSAPGAAPGGTPGGLPLSGPDL